MKTENIAYIQNGEIIPVFDEIDDQQKYKSFLSRNEGSKVKLILDTDIFNRTKKQNDFLHGPMLNTFMELCRIQNYKYAHDREYVKENIMKKPFLGVYDEETGEWLYNKPTSKLSTKSFSEFCNNCFRMLENFGISLDKDGQRQYLELIKEMKLEDKISEVMK